MSNQFGKRHVFMVISLLMLVTTPFLVFLLPNWNANNLYHTPSNWYVFVEGSTYGMYAVGFVLLVVGSAVLAVLDCSRKAIYIAILCVVLAGSFFYVAGRQYIALADDSIRFRDMFSKGYSYQWSEVERVQYNKYPAENEFPNYVFHFTDGHSLNLIENRQLSAMRESVKHRLKMEGIAIDVKY